MKTLKINVTNETYDFIKWVCGHNQITFDKWIGLFITTEKTRSYRIGVYGKSPKIKNKKARIKIFDKQLKNAIKLGPIYNDIMSDYVTEAAIKPGPCYKDLFSDHLSYRLKIPPKDA